MQDRGKIGTEKRQDEEISADRMHAGGKSGTDMRQSVNIGARRMLDGG